MTAREQALAGLAQLYGDLERELQELRPRCDLSGRCCNFKKSGQTLFATDLEIDHLARTAPLVAGDDPELCPWWRGGLCHARDGRPLGCRVYFCDTTKKAELEEISGRYHARLKRLHDEGAPAPDGTDGLPYRYSPFVARVVELAR